MARGLGWFHIVPSCREGDGRAKTPIKELRIERRVDGCMVVRLCSLLKRVVV